MAVRVRPGGSGWPAREISLDLPDDASCARLLRDPFSATVTAPRRLDPRLRPASNLVFSANGAKLFARAAGGGLVSFSIPNSPRAEAGPPRGYDPVPATLPVAVGVSRKRVLLASSRDGGLVLHELHRRGGATLTAGYAPDPEGPGFLAPDPGEPAALQPLLGAAQRLWVRDASGLLFQLSGPSAQDPGTLRYAGTATAASVSAGVLTFVEPASGDSPARLIRAVGDRLPEIVAEIRGPGRRAFFGFGGPLSDTERGLVAVEHADEGTWQIFGRHGDWFLTPFAGTQVVGVGRDAEQPGGPGLLLLDEDGRTLVLAGRNWSRKVVTASSEIEHVTLHHASPRFAYTTASGEIAVGSLDHDGFLFRLVPEDAV